MGGGWFGGGTGGIRARLGRARWGVVTGAEGWAASRDDGPLHVTFGMPRFMVITRIAAQTYWIQCSD